VTNAEDGNEEDVDFNSLLCTKIVFSFQKPIKYPWGQEFSVDETAMAGKYYQNWGSSKSSYVLLRRSLTDHKMQGNDLVYMLFEHVEDGIRQHIATL